MWLNENLIKFLESSAEISKTTIYISNLRNIKLSTGTKNNKTTQKLNKLMSRELLESLLIVGTGLEQDKYIINNSKNNVIPLLDNEIEETNFVSQIILPIWYDNELQGSLVLATENRKLDDYDLELARSIQIFIEESIINSINEEYIKQTEKKKTKPLLKKDKDSNTITNNFRSSNNDINNLNNTSNIETEV